jgi:hypothetical protein
MITRAGGLLAIASVMLSQKPVGNAQRGDAVIAILEGRETFGIVSGGGYWCGPHASGLVFRPMADVNVVFAV